MGRKDHTQRALHGRLLTMLRATVLCLLGFLSLPLLAQQELVPEMPKPPRLVNNLSTEFPDFLSAEETARLEAKLVRFSDSTSNQIVVVIVDDLNGMEPWTFATELGQKWGVGGAKQDNGVVVLIKTKAGDGRGKAHIAVGYGLEGAIPDLTAKRIYEEEIVPYLKQGQHFLALDKSTDVIMALAKGEYNYKAYQKGKGKSSGRLVFYFILIILVMILLSGRNRGGGMTIGRRGTIFGPTFGGGGWGGFGGGSSGGGGFGGFGGGGFGGGGAGGDW